MFPEVSPKRPLGREQEWRQLVQSHLIFVQESITQIYGLMMRTAALGPRIETVQQDDIRETPWTLWPHRMRIVHPAVKQTSAAGQMSKSFLVNKLISHCCNELQCRGARAIITPPRCPPRRGRLPRAPGLGGPAQGSSSSRPIAASSARCILACRAHLLREVRRSRRKSSPGGWAQLMQEVVRQ